MINKSILVGRLTADPELRQTKSKVSVTRFSVACNRPTGKDGKEKADFISCIAWRHTAEFICKYFRKGDAIGIDGYIQTGSYIDKDNIKKYTTEVLAERVSFVERKNRKDDVPFPEPPPEYSSQNTDYEDELENGDDLRF